MKSSDPRDITPQSPADAPQSPQDAPRVLIAMLTGERSECCISFLTSMISLNHHVARLGLRVAYTVVESPDDALNTMHADPSVAATVLAHVSKGFSPEFVLQALAGPHALVVGCWPDPSSGGVDWGAVQARLDTHEKREETLRDSGWTYSVVPLAAAGEPGEYLEVESGELDVSVIKREVTDAVSKTFPGLVHRDGVAFAREGFWPPRGHTPEKYCTWELVSGSRRLCRAWAACGGKVFADLARPCTHFGPTGFQGCVGARMASGAPLR